MLQDFVYIKHIGKYLGETITLKGWVYNLRSSGKIRFVILRDGTGYLQCVAVKGEASEEIFEKIGSLTQESSVVVQGVVREDKRAPGGYECTIKNLEIFHLSADYPIGPKEHGTDFLMNHRHLWLRSKLQHAILRVRDEICKATRDFFYDNDFVLIDSPILTPAACEGTTTLFETNYFDIEKAYLTQSGQLYLEPACQAFGRVYCFGPTFRAEKSKTRRHLTEFWMIEPEIAYADLDDIIGWAEKYVSYLVERCLERKREDLKILERDFSKLEKISAPFPRLQYDDAVKFLQSKGMKFEWGGDFGSADETAISDSFEKPVIVHRFPTAMKAFYMEPDPKDEKLSLSMDVLAPEGYGEIVGGSVRINSLELLEKRIKEHNLPKEAFEWYLDVRRYGSVPHAGFGLGIERTVAWICGIEHIRETIPYPRTITRIYP